MITGRTIHALGALVAISAALGWSTRAAWGQDEPPLDQPSSGPTIISQPAGSQPAADAPSTGTTTVLPNKPIVTDAAPDRVIATDASPTPAGTTVVTSPPVWIEGHFEKEPDTWVRIEGRWHTPLIGSPIYIPPTMERRIGLVKWVPGHWQGGVAPAVIQTQPTTAITTSSGTTVVTPAPAPTTTTVQGYWKRGLLGNYRWVPGQMIVP